VIPSIPGALLSLNLSITCFISSLVNFTSSFVVILVPLLPSFLFFGVYFPLHYLLQGGSLTGLPKLFMLVVSDPSDFVRVVIILLCRIFPYANLYTCDHVFLDAVALQNSFHEFIFSCFIRA